MFWVGGVAVAGGGVGGGPGATEEEVADGEYEDDEDEEEGGEVEGLIGHWGGCCWLGGCLPMGGEAGGQLIVGRRDLQPLPTVVFNGKVSSRWKLEVVSIIQIAVMM